MTPVVYGDSHVWPESRVGTADTLADGTVLGDGTADARILVKLLFGNPYRTVHPGRALVTRIDQAERLTVVLGGLG